MSIQFTSEKDEILQYRFLGSFLREEISKFPECVAFWYNYEQTQVSVAVYGLNQDTARLFFLATLPDYQMRGFQSELQKYAENILASIGITKSEAVVYPDDDIIPGSFNAEGQKELLTYYGYEQADGPKAVIVKYKNAKEKLLSNMTPAEFAKKMNKTFDILNEEDIFGVGSLKKQFLSHENLLSESEQGLFAIKDDEIKCGIIYEESAAFDLNIKRVIKIKDAKFLLGPVFANYIVNHYNLKEDWFKVFTDDESVLSVIDNIIGKPIETAGITCYEKEILEDTSGDFGNYLSVYDKWTMEDESFENSESTFELIEAPCLNCKYSKPGNFDRCAKFEAIPWEVLVADAPCDKYSKKI